MSVFLKHIQSINCRVLLVSPTSAATPTPSPVHPHTDFTGNNTIAGSQHVTYYAGLTGEKLTVPAESLLLYGLANKIELMNM